MNRALALAVWVAAFSPLVHAQEGPTTGPLQFQEVVTVGGATRDQIYSTALTWFSQTFAGSRGVLEQNKSASILIGKSEERYVPPLTVRSCSGWLRYRVTLTARDGRYFYTIDGFTHVADQVCQRRSFGPLTRDWLSAKISKAIFNLTLQPPGRDGEDILSFTLQPPRREEDDMEVWLDLRKRATSIGAALAKSLRARLATAAAGKPAA